MIKEKQLLVEAEEKLSYKTLFTEVSLCVSLWGCTELPPSETSGEQSRISSYTESH